jgi:putative sigma-54 modulation protein
MEVIVQSLGFKAGAELENYVSEKLSKLDRRVPDVVRANVMLFLGPDSQPDNKHCEIRLEMPGNDHFVKKHGETWELAIVEAVDTLESLVRKAKEKMQDRRP